jgi:hypothetical protein
VDQAARTSEVDGPAQIVAGTAESDLRVGGRYHIQIRGADDEHNVSGVYREIVPNEKLEFFRKNREFHLPKPKSFPQEIFDIHSRHARPLHGRMRSLISVSTKPISPDVSLSTLCSTPTLRA